MIEFDADLTWKPIAERLALTDNPRHRRMLEQLLNHSRGEVEGDLERVMATLSEQPVYHIWQGGPEMSPQGLDDVRRFYVEEIFGKGRHVFEGGKYRIVVDDDTIVTEGIVKSLGYGANLARSGYPIDDQDAVYLTAARMLIVWPFDADCKIIGEESWAIPCGIPIQKLDWADVPENYQKFVEEARLVAA